MNTGINSTVIGY